MKTTDVMLRLLETYLATSDERDDFQLLEVDREQGTAVHLGDFETPEEAIRWAMDDYRAHVATCADTCGEPPTNLLHKTQFVLGGKCRRSIRTITYCNTQGGNRDIPAMVISGRERATRMVDAGRRQRERKGSSPNHDGPQLQNGFAMLNRADELCATGHADAGAVLARAALDVHVQRLFDDKGLRPGKSKKANRLGGRVQQLRELGVIGRETCGQFLFAVDVGKAGAHGRPVIAADVGQAIAGLRQAMKA